ncbi:MAG: hypothetical protein Q9163_003435 [Psora crenata]
MTDLEADLEDRLDECWEDPQDAANPQSDEALDAIHSNHGVDGNELPQQEDTEMAGVGQAESTSALRSISVADCGNLSPNPPTSSDTGNIVPTSPSLLDRRNAAVTDQIGIRMPPDPMQYLRPITPTQPVMGNAEPDQTKPQTPTIDMLVNEGPMTPTNTAGPFVFDGSAGRVSGRSLSDDASRNNMTEI